MLTRNGFLHIFANMDSATPELSVCLRARARAGEAAATASVTPDDPCVLHVERDRLSRGFLYAGTEKEVIAFRAKDPEAAQQWVEAMKFHCARVTARAHWHEESRTPPPKPVVSSTAAAAASKSASSVPSPKPS